jgi:hypothetical protein
MDAPLNEAESPVAPYPPVQDPELVPYHSRAWATVCGITCVAVWSGYLLFFALAAFGYLDGSDRRFEAVEAWAVRTSGVAAPRVLFQIVFAIAVGLPLLLSFSLFHLMEKLASPPAADVLRKDPRSPVLYLRPFQVDEQTWLK